MPSDSNKLRMFQNCTAGASYKRSSPPPPFRPYNPPGVRVQFILYIIFVVALTLITVCSIFTEIFLSYPAFILSVVLSHVPSGGEIVRLTEILSFIEYLTRIQTSVLAFSTLVYLWYRVSQVLFPCVSRRFGYGSSVQSEDKGTFISTVYVPCLLAVIVLNDSIYNQYQPFSFSPVPVSSLIAPSPPTINLDIFGVIMVPGLLVRCGWMAFHALPVCAIEVMVLFIILYFIVWSTSSSSVSSSDLEKVMVEDQLAPPIYDSDECAPVYDAKMQLYHIPYYEELDRLDDKEIKDSQTN